MNTESFRRAVDESLNRSGMTAGLPKVTVDAARLAHLLDHYEWLREEEKKLLADVSVLLEALEDAADALDSDNPDIQLRAAMAARAAVRQTKGD
jgi:hypothetical protein